MHKSIFFFIALLCVGNVYAFEVDGFKSGMSYDAVKRKISTWNFDKVVENDQSIQAYDLPEKKSGRSLTLNFCKNQLAGVQKDYPPTMKNYITLTNEYRSKFGNPIDINTKIELTSIGETHNIYTFWESKVDSFSLNYGVYPANDQLYIYVNTKKNSCW
jgi:hypothetical protein